MGAASAKLAQGSGCGLGKKTEFIFIYSNCPKDAHDGGKKRLTPLKGLESLFASFFGG